MVRELVDPFSETQVSLPVFPTSQPVTKKTVTASTSGNTTIHAPAAGKKVRLYYFGYSAGSTVTGILVGLRFGAAGTIFDNEYLSAAGQPYARNIGAGRRHFDGAVDEALIVNLGASGQTVYVNVEVDEV